MQDYLPGVHDFEELRRILRNLRETVPEARLVYLSRLGMSLPRGESIDVMDTVAVLYRGALHEPAQSQAVFAVSIRACKVLLPGLTPYIDKLFSNNEAAVELFDMTLDEALRGGPCA